MMTSKNQEMTSGLSADCKELLTILHKLIETDSQTCLKTLLKKNRGKFLMKKKAML
jgi:predicted transcriptional regulator